MLASWNCVTVIPDIDCDTVNDILVFGFNDGDDVGCVDGNDVGDDDGWLDGCDDGWRVGCLDGRDDGWRVGWLDGCDDGCDVGCLDGWIVGILDGCDDGCPEGSTTGERETVVVVGLADGNVVGGVVGAWEGLQDGDVLGSDGSIEDTSVGSVVGDVDGETLGAVDGVQVGIVVGISVGGINVGLVDGTTVGDKLLFLEGSNDGDADDGGVGIFEAYDEGFDVAGWDDGWDEGILTGCCDGWKEGVLIGCCDEGWDNNTTGHELSLSEKASWTFKQLSEHCWIISLKYSWDVQDARQLVAISSHEAEQDEHCDAPTWLNWFLGQGRHTDDPVTLANVPAGQ